MSRRERKELESHKIYGEKAADLGEYSEYKGLRPVASVEMINFLEWVSSNHPEITRMESLPELKFQALVREYESFSTIRQPYSTWLLGQRSLQEGYSSEAGYDSVRLRKKQLGL